MAVLMVAFGTVGRGVNDAVLDLEIADMVEAPIGQRSRNAADDLPGFRIAMPAGLDELPVFGEAGEPVLLGGDPFIGRDVPGDALGHLKPGLVFFEDGHKRQSCRASSLRHEPSRPPERPRQW
ncbi:hypothetical protein [Rhodovulum visakhapatnamense]|uniref:hypothetical protein n=1 Tax=Rhodovulum visakhapatnamense TaxID=364297 RepID=UPI001065DA78|nr:hypothetical protein [Rhodovulum visakhapatnamense]